MADLDLVTYRRYLRESAEHALAVSQQEEGTLAAFLRGYTPEGT